MTSYEQKQAARRASSCRACRADGADIGAFDRGIAHTYAPDCFAPGREPTWITRKRAGLLPAKELAR
jgi:hypothetical protein